MDARGRPSETLPECPFCSFTAASHSESDVYLLLKHVEFSHNDQDSPFMAREASPNPTRRERSSSTRIRSRSNIGRNYRDSSPAYDEGVYVDCPLQCGEFIHIREMDDHIELHEIEGLGLDELDGSPGPAYGSRNASPRPGSRRARTPSHDMDVHLNSYGGFLKTPDSKAERKHASAAAGLEGLRDLVLGPSSKKHRHRELSKKSDMVKRLGVSSILYGCDSVLTCSREPN